MFPQKRRNLPYNSRLVPVLIIKDQREVTKDKDKVQDVMITEEDSSRVVHVTKKAKILSWSKGIVLVATVASGLIKIDSLLELDRT